MAGDTVHSRVARYPPQAHPGITNPWTSPGLDPHFSAKDIVFLHAFWQISLRLEEKVYKSQLFPFSTYINSLWRLNRGYLNVCMFHILVVFEKWWVFFLILMVNVGLNSKDTKRCDKSTSSKLLLSGHSVFQSCHCYQFLPVIFHTFMKIDTCAFKITF